MYRLFPSQSWELHISLQAMFHSSLYSSNETMVTLFYEDSELFQVPGRSPHGCWGVCVGGATPQGGWCQLPCYCLPPSQLVYLINDQQGRLVKRPVPVVKLLMYEQHSKHYYMERRG